MITHPLPVNYQEIRYDSSFDRLSIGCDVVIQYFTRHIDVP